MSISVFIESYSEDMGNHRRQVLLVPIDGNIRVYSRFTDGLKGPQNKWNESDLDDVVNGINPAEQVTAEPVGVVVTHADEVAIRDKGYSPVLTTKATAAHLKSGPAEDLDPTQTICDLYDMVLRGDDSLNNRVIDNRRQASVLPAPVIQREVAEVDETTTVEVEVNVTNHAPVIHAALASVPRKELAERYIHRKVMGDAEDFTVFDFARAEKNNVLIYGPTGPGKTTAVEAWAAERGLRMATVSGNAALEPGHLFGKFVSDGRGGYAWIDGPVTDVVRNGGVLLLDEFNFISPKIYTVLYPLTDARRVITLLDHHGEVIEAHDDLTIFATMNPEYIGTTALNHAMRNRFDIQIPWDYDDKVESKLIKSKNLLALAKQLRDEAAKGQYETPISTNMLVEFCKLVDGLSYAFAVENFIAHFSPEEQASVRLVFQTHEYNLKPDFGIKVEVVTNIVEEATNEVVDEINSAIQNVINQQAQAMSTVASPTIVNI